MAGGSPPARPAPRPGGAHAPERKIREAAAPGPPGPRPPCAKEKAPPMSGTPYPPTDFLRSTFGEEGLNFRVRNGIG